MTKLAADELTISIDGVKVHLRPSLKAAMRLERKYQGFEKLALEVTNMNLSAIIQIIEEASTEKTIIPDLLNKIASKPLQRGVEHLVAPLLSFIFQLAGFDVEDDHEEQETKAKTETRITFAEHHTRLFRIATGWLGWSPEIAWASTPNEITEAYQGRVEMLKAIYGGSDEEEQKPQDLATQARIAFAKLGTKIVKPEDAA
jgi:hypothetical protein